MDEFEKIYTRYLKEVYRFLLRLSGNPHTAEELTQETFSIAFENLHKFRGTCKLSVWLFQIAKHEYYAYCKKQKKLVDEEKLKEHVSGDNVEEAVIDTVEGLRIHEILHGMPEPYKEVFTLRTMGELSYKDISCIFKKSESWARVTYYRARRMIQERLGGDLYDEM